MWGCSNHSLAWWSTLQAEEIDPQLAPCFIVPILWRCVDLPQQRKLCFQTCVSKINSPTLELRLVELSTAGAPCPWQQEDAQNSKREMEEADTEGGGTQDGARQAANLCSDSGDGCSPGSLPTWWKAAISVPLNSLPWQAFRGDHVNVVFYNHIWFFNQNSNTLWPCRHDLWSLIL